MMKRHVRLRREYLYKKSQEQRTRAELEERERVAAAARGNKSLGVGSTREAERAREMLDASGWDDAETKRMRTHVDDEYASAVARGAPKVCVTTSREPSAKLKEFAKEVRLIFPTSVRVNRGQMTLPELVEACRAADFTDIVVCTEHRGDPDGLIVSHLPYGPTAKFSLSDCVMRHDIGKEAAGNASEAMPHLVFEGFSSKVGLRFKDILQHLFPVPPADSKRLQSFVNRNDVVSFRHHVFKTTGAKHPGKKPTVEMTEVGPRFEMVPYEIRLGTLDQRDAAEVEWALRSFTNRRGPVLAER